MGVHFPLINNAQCDVLEYHLKNPSICLHHQGHRRHALLQFIYPLWQIFLHIPAIVVCKVISQKFENPKPSPVGRLQCNNYSCVHWLMNSCSIGRQAKYTSTRSCPITWASNLPIRSTTLLEEGTDALTRGRNSDNSFP